MRPLLISLFLAVITIATASQPDFHSVSTHNGDGVYSLLRRYHLLEGKANISKFFELNKMTSKEALKSKQEYLIPVYIYTYDGKSIRSTVGDKDWDRAIEIKNYNEKILAEGIRKTHYTDSKLLWVPFHMTAKGAKEPIKKEIAPKEQPKTDFAKTVTNTTTKSGKTLLTRKFDIFGDKYAETPIYTNNLQGKIYYIVSGHGGPDPGAMTKANGNTICEDEYAYDIALRLSRKLIQHGAIVHVIVRDENDGIRDEAYLNCDRDETTNTGKTIPLNQVTRLRQRVNDINTLHAKYKKRGIKDQYCIVLHVDSRHKDKRTDLYFYHHKNSKKSKKLSKNIFSVFKSKYAKYRNNGEYHGSITSRNLHMIRETHPPTVYIEMGNLRNSLDQKRFLLNTNRQAVADWITEGCLK